MALLLVAGLLVADVVTYAAVRSFLYGRADSTLAQDEAHAFDYFTFAAAATTVSQADLSRRISTEVYVGCWTARGTWCSGARRVPSPPGPGTGAHPKHPGAACGRHLSPRARRPFRRLVRPDPNAVVLGAKGDTDGAYRAVAVTVPQGTLVTALSLNQTNDTLASLRNVELVASLSVLLALVVLALAVVRRGLRPLRQMADTAAAIASGDLARRVPEEESGHRGGAAGSALNEMLARIEGAFAEKSASEERLRQFVADASHELRTPLTSIRGYAELLGRGGFPDEASRRKALKRVEEEATRMGGLVEDLLLLAELDQGRPLRTEAVDLHHICADAVD